MSTRHLLNNAQSGNFEAAVQVFLNYRDGALDFEKNEEHAQLAFENIISILSSDFYLNELNISNFKKILDLKIVLHKKLTVFIGENGAGKTSLLRAIQKNLSWFSAFILKENTNGERIVDSEINNQAKKNGEVAYVNCSFRMGAENRIDGQLVREPKGITTDLRTEVMEYRKFGKNIREIIVYQKINLPIFMFYDIERFKQNDSKKTTNQENNFFQLDGYEKLSNSKATFETFIDWLVKVLKISSTNINTDEKNKISSQLNSLIEAGAKSEDSPLNELYEDLLSLLNLFPDDDTKKKSKKILADLEQLFKNIYPEIINIKLINEDNGEDKVALCLERENIFLHQFSDGQRVLFGLIGDIARRLILLNPNLSSPFEGAGIVLIDEIELHLHPKWQQKVILILQKKFPNIQFILTTHSPHVLSTVDKNSIYIINAEREIDHPTFQTKGVTSSDVLERIMKTESIPDVDEAKMIKTYLNSIQDNSYELQHNYEIFKKLVLHFGEEHPEILKCKQQVQIKEMNLKIQNLKKSILD